MPTCRGFPMRPNQTDEEASECRRTLPQSACVAVPACKAPDHDVLTPSEPDHAGFLQSRPSTNVPSCYAWHPSETSFWQNSPQMPYFTNMRLVFEALPGVCVAHDWLISDLECNWLPTEDDDVSPQPDERFTTKPVLLDVRDLHQIVSPNEIQFHFAVF